MVGVREERADGQRPQAFGSHSFQDATTHKQTYPSYGKVARVKVDPTLEGGWKHSHKTVPNCPADETFMTTYTAQHAMPGWQFDGHPRSRFNHPPTQPSDGQLSKHTINRTNYVGGPVQKPRTFVRGKPNEYTHPQGLKYPDEPSKTKTHNQDTYPQKNLSPQKRHPEDIVYESRPYIKNSKALDSKDWSTTKKAQFLHPQKTFPAVTFPPIVAPATDKYRKATIPTGVAAETVSMYNHVNNHMTGTHLTFKNKYPGSFSTAGPTFAGDA